MSRFAVYCDPDGMEELCQYSPYNLKKDLKHIPKEELREIVVHVADELYQGVQRPPASSMMYWGRDRKAGYGKIRTVDVERANGKSSGYRCIVLVDMMNCRAFILHIYRHGRDDVISANDKKRLKCLVDLYVESILAS